MRVQKGIRKIDHPMTSHEMRTFLHKNGIYNFEICMRDEIPKKHLSTFTIWNLDSKNSTGTHWTASCITSKGKVLYFDSFGVPAPEAIRQYLMQIDPKYPTNNNQVQETFSLSCGWFCVLWIFFIDRGGVYYDFLHKLFGYNLEVNERILADLFK